MTLKRVEQKKIGELLIESEKLTQDQLNLALESQKQDGGVLGEILVSMGIITEEEIVACLAIQYEIPYLDIKNYDFDENVYSLFPKELMRDYQCIPLDKMGKLVTVVVSDPLDEDVLMKIEESTGCQVQCFIGKLSDIKDAITKYMDKNEHAER